MGVLNNIFKWIILERIKEIDDFSKNPNAKQTRLMNTLLQNASNTEWGKIYDYKSIRNYSEYSERVPLQDYNSLKPYIERMMKGEQNVIWPTDVNWFAKSSGTTDDKSKFIPVSKESMMDCHYKAGKDMYAMYYNQYPNANLVDGKSLVLGGSHQVNKLNENSYYGDLSAVLMQNLPIWAEAKRVPVLSIALMDNWEEKIEKMAKAILKHKVTNVLGIPTWTTILFRRLLDMTGKNNISEIWPMLELYVHGGVSFNPYRNLFKELLPNGNMHYMETYNASEGFFAIQDSPGADDMLLMLDYGIFYEFIPVDGTLKQAENAVSLEDVELNKNYALIITTNSGLWRYKIGDTIRFTSKDPYRIKISGRTKHYINAFGEELMIENAEKALAFACEHTNSIVTDFTAAPVYFSRDGNGAHEWLIEFEKDPQDFQEFIRHLDETLKRLNSDYEAKRFKDMALQRPIVRKLNKGTFYEWMKKRGKLGGQNKVPRLSNSREFVDDILEFAGEKY